MKFIQAISVGIHLTELREDLLQDNPILVKFIESQVGKYPREIHNAMFEVVMGTIATLRLQGKVDEKGPNLLTPKERL
jgi:hypothetical protein